MIQYILHKTLEYVCWNVQKCQRKWEEVPPDRSLTLIVKASKVACGCAIFLSFSAFFSDPNEYQHELTIPLLTVDVNSPKFCRQRRET